MKMLTGLSAGERRRGTVVRPAARRPRPRRAKPRRLHVAIVFALFRADGSAEPRSARPSLSPAGAQGESAHRRIDRSLWSCRPSRPIRRGPAARHSPAAVAGGRRRPRTRDADPRRADLGCRSAGARPVLGIADRPVAQPERDDLRVDPFHERGRALRPDFADGSWPGTGDRHAGGARRGARCRKRSKRRSSAIWKRLRAEACVDGRCTHRSRCHRRGQPARAGRRRSVVQPPPACSRARSAKRWSCCEIRSVSALPCSPRAF